MDRIPAQEIHRTLRIQILRHNPLRSGQRAGIAEF